MRENETFKHNVVYNKLSDTHSLFDEHSALITESARRTLGEENSSTEQAIIFSAAGQKFTLLINKKPTKPCSSRLGKKSCGSLQTETTTYCIKAQDLVHILSRGMRKAQVANLVNPNKHATEFLVWFNHSLLQSGFCYELNPHTDEPEIRGRQDISDKLLQDIIKKARANPNAYITFADTSSRFTPAISSLDLIMLIMSFSSIPSLKLHSRFALYFDRTPVLISTSRAFIKNDEERKIAEMFQQNLLTTFADNLFMDIRDTSTLYHLSYVYWILRTSLDEDYLYDTPLDTKTLNEALKVGSLAQNDSLDPRAFFIDVMFLEEPDFIEKYRGSVRVDRHIPTMSAHLVQPTEAEGEDQASQKKAKKAKKAQVKCPQKLKGKSSAAVVTYLKSITSDPLKQGMLAKQFIDYAASHNRNYPAVHMNEIKKIAAMADRVTVIPERAAMADRVKVIPGRPDQPSRLFVVHAEDRSKMDEVERCIINHFGAGK